MTGMWSDLQHATRSLWRDRTAFVVAVATLAIGLAANTTVFSLVHALEFPTLPYPQADRLVFLETNNQTRGIRGMLVSIQDAVAHRETTRTLDALTITADTSAVVEGLGGRRREGGRQVDASFFDVFGSSPRFGRTLQPIDTDTTLVISHRLWTMEHGETWREGRTLRLDGRDRQIVGVMPAAFDGDADFWMPWTPSAAGAAADDRQYPVFARLAEGHSLIDVNAELAQRSDSLATTFAETNSGWTMVAFPIAQLHGRDDRAAFFQLQAAVGLVLLVICANVANVLLARHARQRHESAIRVALGAARFDLLRARLAEGLVLAGFGGALGLLIALWSIRAVRGLGGFASTLEPTLNLTVLAASALAALLTGLLCALVPAWAEAHRSMDSIRVGGSRTTTGRGRGQQALVTAQVAGAVVLGILGTLLTQSWLARQRVDLGFSPSGVVRADVDGLATPALAEVLTTITSATGVDAAAASATVARGVDAVTPGYFDTLGIPLLDGRMLADSDRSGTELVAVVDVTRARALQPDANVVGQFVQMTDDAAAPRVRIVGVVGATRRSVMHASPTPRTYVPMTQAPPQETVQLLARGAGNRPPDARELTTAVSRASGTAIVSNAGTLAAELAQFTAPLRLMTTVLTAFALVGGVLVALGVFGATSYATSVRMREFAVRAALGSSSASLARLVFRTAAIPSAVGAVVGLALSVAAVRAVDAYLFGTTPLNPAALVWVIVLLAMVIGAAALRPAWIAARVDPARTLRND